MARDTEQLVLSISADTAQIRRALKRLEGDTARSTRTIERQFSTMNTRMNASAVALGRTMVGVFAGVASARGAQQLIDTSVKIQNALKVTGLEGENLTEVYDALFASAQRNSAPLETLVTLYSRVSQSAAELGATQTEIVKFTDNVALSLRASGQSATETSGALLQLAQAIGGGIVQAEEYNSLLDGARPLLQAVATGLEEAGGSVSTLTRLVKSQQVSSEAFFRAFEAGAYILEDQVANAGTTVAQAFVRLQNVLIDTAGELNEGTDASETLAGAIEWVADAVANADFGPFIAGLERVANTAGEVIGFVDRLGAALGSLTGLDQVGEYARNRIAQSDIAGRLDGAFAADAKGDRPTALPAITTTGTVRPTVSLSDYDAPASKKGGAGGGGNSTKDRADEYQRLSERIRETTAALQVETSIIASLDPLVDDYGFAVEKARMEHELLTAAQKAGKAVTPQLRAEIAGLAETYALATSEAAKLAERQGDIRDAAEDLAEFNQDLARGIVDGFMEGKDAADIFADALGKIADRLLDMAFESIFSSLGGGGGLLKALGFRANGGPIETNKPYIVGERGPEMIVPNRSGMVIPNNLLGKNGSGSQTITLRVIGEEGPMFRPTIQAVSQDVSVSVVRQNNEALTNLRQNGGN